MGRRGAVVNGWRFEYRPIERRGNDEPSTDLIVATLRSPDPSVFQGMEAEVLLDRAPLHWTRVRAREADVRRRVAATELRYVAPADRASDIIGAPLLRGAPVARPADWRARRGVTREGPRGEGSWFLGKSGVSVDRDVCGTGAGTRVAVLDDDAAEAEQLDLDAEILVRIARPPRAGFHGALMVAWTVGTRTGFQGVAPDASPRLYSIPKPEIDVVSLPLALARAVFDGADVALCPTYVEGTTSPMLDDALEVARALGRRGRGTAVVMPAGREASSPPGSMHASLALSLGDPAADPRVFCVGPSGREGGWFLWVDKKGRLRPFANRGPSLRWLAPGDDLAYPFSARERLIHAESSGASAVAAGVLLLVLANNPQLTVAELDAIVTRTLVPVTTVHDARRGIPADAHDLLPTGADADGHNAKTGYGRMNATLACLLASDPVRAALVAIGEVEAAERWRAPYSRRLARWAARALLADTQLDHGMRALARHARLVAGDVAHQASHGPRAMARQIEILARVALSRPLPRISSLVRGEITRLRVDEDALRAAIDRLLSHGEMIQDRALVADA
jgi:hypothetical protein